MNGTVSTTFVEYARHYGVGQTVTLGLLVWSIVKTVKLFKKFTHNIVPSVLLELVFLINIPVILIAILFLRFLPIVNVVWFNFFVCALYNGIRLSLLFDLCLNYLDKFVALFWCEHYKATGMAPSIEHIHIWHHLSTKQSKSKYSGPFKK